MESVSIKTEEEMLSRLITNTYRKFFVKIPRLGKQNGANRNQRSAQVFSMPFGAFIVGSILACLLMDSQVKAQEHNSVNEEIHRAVLLTEVTEANFEEIQHRLKNDDPSIASLNMRFILTKKKLEELKEAIQNNIELGYISWHKDQVLSEDLNTIESKLISNNQNYQYHPNDYMHALLSYHAYTDVKENDAVILNELSLDDNTKEALEGWRAEKVHNYVHENGYYGVIYKNDKTHQIVLANRGTEGGAMGITTDLFKRHSDWNTNLKEIFIGQIVVLQQAKNYAATEEAVKIAKKSGYRLSFAGHSLGAWLAELSAFYSYSYFDFRNIKAVTFDSPGALPMMKKLQSNIKSRQTQVDFNDIDIVTYLANPNPINCCNEHMGRVYQVKTALEWTDWVYNHLPICIKNQIGDIIQGLLAAEGHQIKEIVESFDPVTGKPKEYQRMADWPRFEYQGDPRNFADQRDTILAKMFEDLGDVPWPLSELGGKVNTKAFDYIIGDSTLMTLIDFLLNLSQIDQRQYWAYFENMDLAIKAEKCSIDKRFALIAKAKYREGDDGYVLNPTKGSVDDYLYALYKSKERLGQRKDLSRMTKIQLEDLLRQFIIKESISDGKHQLVPTDNYNVESIREVSRRLFSILPKNTIESLWFNVDWICEAGNGLALPDNLPWQATAYHIQMQDQEKELALNLSKGPVAVISGIGGMGKSTLAATYGRNCKQSGWQVRWIKGKQIEEEFLQLAKDMNIISDNLLPQEVRDLIYRNFAKFFQGQEVLLIFDNVENKEKIKQYLMNLPNNVKVIITARNGDLVEGIKPIKLLGFDKEQAILYVQKALDNEKEASVKLVQTVGESPFRLSKAVTYLKNHHLTNIDKFVSEYEAIKKGHNQHAEIYPEVELLFRDLKTNASNRLLLQRLVDIILPLFFIDKNVDSWELLKYLACLDADGVSLKLIESITGEDENEFQNLVSELEKLSLVNVVKEGDQTKLKISHRIVQNETKKALIEEDRTQIRRILEKLIYALNKVFPFVDENPDNWKEMAELVGHAKTLIQERDVSVIRREELLRKIGYFYYYAVLDYKEAIRYWEEALSYQKHVYKKNHPKIANSFNDLGIAYYALGGKENISKGLQYLEESLKLKRKVFPRLHRRVAASLNNLGIVYYALGGKENISKGLNYRMEALKIFFPGNYPSVEDVLNNAGFSYEDLEVKHQEDVLKMKQALFLSNQADLPDSFNLPHLFNNIAGAYEALGGKENIRKGLKYFEKSLKMKQSLFSRNHPSVADSLYNLGNAYSKLGDSDKRLEYYKQAYGIYSMLFDEGDAQTKAIKSYIESVQPKFFSNKSLSESLKQEDCLGGNKVGFECRWIISSRGVTNYNLIDLKLKIQKDVLNNVIRAVQNCDWSNVNWFGMDWGVKGYIDKAYLKEKLEELGNNTENIELAQMLCFESMNLGIMKAEEKPYSIVQEFTKDNAALVKKIAEQHPEFFVDGSIVEACVRGMSNDTSFQKHILAHVKYMGMEERRK